MLKQLKLWLFPKKLNLGYTEIIVEDEEAQYLLGIVVFYYNPDTAKRYVKIHTALKPRQFIIEYNNYFIQVKVREWLDNCADFYDIIKNPSKVLKESRQAFDNKRWDEDKGTWVTNLTVVEKELNDNQSSRA
jgi:hypothetical protein